MSEKKDKLIEPDQGNPQLEGYRQAGKGLVEEGNNLQEIDDSTDVARQSTVPDEIIHAPSGYVPGNITGYVEVNTEDVKGDFALPDQSSDSEDNTISGQISGPDAGGGASNTIREMEDTSHDKSYMPGSGAVRTAEDRLKKGDVDPDSVPPGAGVF